MNRTTKTIVLLEVHNGGHHEAFMQLFARSLLELGHRVLCMMPDTTDVEQWVRTHCRDSATNASFHPTPYPPKPFSPNGKIKEVLNRLYLWQYYRKQIDNITKQEKVRPDLVFFNNIDGFLGNYVPAFLVDRIFPYPWSGLYFQPNHLRAHPDIFDKKARTSDIDNLFTCRHCLAAVIHDMGVVQDFSRRLNGKPVILFPEVADFSVPDPENQTAREIREKARGRTVIGVIGMEPHKGSYEFMRLARTADPNQYFFAFCGRFEETYYKRFFKPGQAEEFRGFISSLPENCYWNSRILTEGPEYNAVFNAFDVIFLYYPNFYGTSNRLTKAAYFKKPVISNHTNCIGEDVLRFNLGEVVTQHDDDHFLSALNKVREKILAGDLPYASWERYLQINSEPELKNRFEDLISRL